MLKSSHTCLQVQRGSSELSQTGIRQLGITACRGDGIPEPRHVHVYIRPSKDQGEAELNSKADYPQLKTIRNARLGYKFSLLFGQTRQGISTSFSPYPALSFRAERSGPFHLLLSFRRVNSYLLELIYSLYPRPNHHDKLASAHHA